VEPEGSLCVHKNPPLAQILSQMKPVLALPSSFFDIHFNIILPSTQCMYVYGILQEFVTFGFNAKKSSQEALKWM
jgi:hypothetical protein